MYWLIWQYLTMTGTPLAISRIHESLGAALARKRVVLWPDANGECCRWAAFTAGVCLALSRREQR